MLLVPSTFPTWPRNIFADKSLESYVPLSLQRGSILTSFLYPYASQLCVRQNCQPDFSCQEAKKNSWSDMFVKHWLSKLFSFLPAGLIRAFIILINTGDF